MGQMATKEKKHELTWLQSFCANVLKAGNIPTHIAFIMDGNRRSARMQNLDVFEGHLNGFETLMKTLHWCIELGILHVTIYAFSIENFKRSEEEVNKLMDTATMKFREMAEHKENLLEKGVCIRVLGDLTYLPRDLQKAIAEIVLYLRHNTKYILDICIAYTSRVEIFQAVTEVCDGVQLNLIRPSDISERLLEQCFYSSGSPDPDLLVRTSGETRLSDFLLWQTSYSVLIFTPVLWPNLTIWNIFLAILSYQMQCNRPKELKRISEEDNELLQIQSDWHSAISEIKGILPEGHDDVIDKNLVKMYAEERERRIDVFLKHVRDKRIKALEDLLV